MQTAVTVLELKQLLSGLINNRCEENSSLKIKICLRQLPTVMAQKLQALRNDGQRGTTNAEINGRLPMASLPLAGRVTTLARPRGQMRPQRLQLEIILLQGLVS